MLRTLILSVIVSILYFPGRAQNFLSTSNDFPVHAITSIQSSQDDYTDLTFLKETLKDKRIVLLGEQTHGDGATFEAKVRLIKFLHQQMGFSMVSFESGLYENYKAYQQTTSNNYQNSPLKESIFSIWSDTKEVELLLQYVHQNKALSHPLVVSGFDSNIGSYLEDDFLPDLKAFNTKLTEADFVVLTQAMNGYIEFIATQPEDSIAFFKTTQKVVNEFDRLLKQKPTDHLKILKQTFIGWLAMVQWEIDIIHEKKIAIQNPRDLQMARNLIFLANLYPDKKIIGWGASYHFANQIETYEKTAVTKKFLHKMDSVAKSKEPTDLDSLLGGAVPMGKILKEHFGEQLYSLAFSSYDGSYGLIGTPVQSLTPVEPPHGSIEHMLKEQGYEYAFVNFNKQNAQEKFYSSALGNLPILAPWQKIFDGLFFIKTSYPPTLVLPEGTQPQVTHADKTKLVVPVVYATGKTKKVMDRQTNEPVSFATVVMAGTSKGVTSNTSGEFVFNIPATHSGSIIVSSIGYESDTLSIKEFDAITQIKLNPKVYALEEFEVSAKPLSAHDIVKRAEKSIKKNYYQGANEQELFYRTSDYVEDSLTFNEEAAILVYDPDGYRVRSNATHKLTGKILQFRNSTKNPDDDLWSGAGSLWMMHSHDAILDKSNVLHRSVFYDLKLEGIVEFENKRVYEISFECNRPGAFTTGYGYSAPLSATGKIFIATETFAVLKFEMHVIRNPEKVNKKNSNYKRDAYGHYLIQTYKEVDGKYFLSYSKQAHYSKERNLKSEKTYRFLSIRELSSTEINTQPRGELVLLLTKIKSVSTPHDPDFWNAHNAMIEDDILTLYNKLGL